MQNTRNELTVILPDEWQVLTQQAKALVDSGFLPQSVNNVQKAVAIMTLGRELGIGAWAALSSINVIQQKPTVSPQLMLALINRSGQLEDMLIADDGQSCTVTMKRRGRTPHTHTFSMQDALAMGLSNKDNWKKQPAIMRQWRAVAACARVVFADVVLGLYTPEEMGADVIADEQGNMQIVEVKREEPRQLQPPPEEPVVTVEQPSASVIGAGVIKPMPPQADADPLDWTDEPLNIYVCEGLAVTKSRTATQYVLKSVKGSNFLLDGYSALSELELNGTPIITLQAATYPLIPAWKVQADKLANGSWDVQKVFTGAPEVVEV